MRLKLLIQYDGRAFYGWQKQNDFPSVQGAFLDAFRQLKLELTDGKIVGAGRTDAGVHAWGQVAHVDVEKRMPLFKYMGGLNRFLPPSVRVMRVAEVEEDFHARFTATARHYTYLLWDGRVMRPDLLGRAGHSIYPLDLEKMQEAIALLGLGNLDFTSFRDADCQSSTPVCELLHFSIARDRDGLLRLDIGANHFLHHMVRNLLGTLVEVGVGKRPPQGLADALHARDRRAAGMTFPPDGLYFARVDYKDHVELEVTG